MMTNDSELLLAIEPVDEHATHVCVRVRHEHRKGVKCRVALVGIGLRSRTEKINLLGPETSRTILLDGDMMHKAPKKLAALVAATFADVRAKRGVVWEAVQAVAQASGKTLAEATP